MATPYQGPVSAVQVGSYFVGQYYQVLQQQPDRVHQFYSEASSMIRIDADSTDSASAMLQIHSVIMSLNFTAIEIKTINSLDSWNGGIVVMVSGSVKTKEFSGRRNFVQTFFLAPQEKGYFVLNDIFQYVDDGTIFQHPTPEQSESKYESQLDTSDPLPEPLVSDYLEEEAREYVTSVHIDDDPVDKYSLPEQQDPETEVVVEESPIEEPSAPLQNVVNAVQETTSVAVEEEPQKKTYASILRVVKAQSVPSVSSQPSVTASKPASDWNQTSADWNQTPSDWNQTSSDWNQTSSDWNQTSSDWNQTSSDWNHTQQYADQQPSSVFPAVSGSGVEAAEEGFGFEEGEPKSVYVRNLSPDVAEVEIEQEFQNFGRIKPDGVFIRSRKDIGVCYAFVEFEDILGVHNALKASPIQLAGRQVYIEERRPNSSGVSRGGRRGRGRGSYSTESTRGRGYGGRGSGRGSNLDSGDYNRMRGNGFHQRGSR
ncbi:hypothetical protein UlMin_031752 [Ulmus minor]